MVAVVEQFDITIIHGHRGKKVQNEAFENGFSRKRWPESKHNRNPSEAVDIAPWPVDWDDMPRWYYMAGIVMATARRMGIPIRWGGDWDGDGDLNDNSLLDLGHFELIE